MARPPQTPSTPVAHTFALCHSSHQEFISTSLLFKMCLTTWLALAHETLASDAETGLHRTGCRGLSSLCALWKPEITRLGFWRKRDHKEQKQVVPAKVTPGPTSCQLPDRRLSSSEVTQPQLNHLWRRAELALTRTDQLIYEIIT